ncbi:DNA primase family protein [Bacillus ndiopicus]|uniref:DNA primase family protein n=1 Tax=Bacillus ndiopicus TaxID=1347368 RepID=UPI0005A5FEC8|nr:phage/plasmid primase, P4 family [Bacillus ndiopicus]
MKYKQLTRIKTNFDSLNSISLETVYPKLNIKDTWREAPCIQIDNIESLNELKLPVATAATTEKQNKYNGISNAELATFFINNFTFLVVEGSLYHWNSDKGIYVLVNIEYADKFIRQNIPSIYKGKINSSSIKEIIQWIKSDENIEIKQDYLRNKINLISFSNGIFDIEKISFAPHNPKYFFTSTINAKYISNSNTNGEYFNNFICDITGGNRYLYLRIQELFGYVISEMRNVKYIPYLLGPKDTGKSIILKLFEHLVGPNSYTNLSFEQLNKPEYLSQLLGKKLNTCGEASEFRLNKLDVFKKLSGGDYVTARPIYEQPINFINSAVLLFAGNHLPTINGLDKSNAFSQRIIIFPFNNPIPKSQQDLLLFEKLLKEKEFIVNWAIEGLIRWKNNNYEFTNYTEIEEMSKAYYEQNNSIDSFIRLHCEIDVSYQIYKFEIEDEYIKYCKQNDISPENKQVLNNYIKSLPNISYSRFRDGKGNNKYGYKGITIKV